MRVHEFKFEFGDRVELEFAFAFKFINSRELELLRTRTRETHIKTVENSNSRMNSKLVKSEPAGRQDHRIVKIVV